MINNHHIYIIAACDEKNGLGKNNSLPWKLKKEMHYFTEITMETADSMKDNSVIMGQTTWESIPEKFRPLPTRKNIVLSHDPSFKANGADVFHSIEDALRAADDSIEDIYIIGGASIYSQTINMPELDGIYLTRIQHDYGCDAFFPEIPESFTIKQKIGTETEDDIHFAFYSYRKKI